MEKPPKIAMSCIREDIRILNNIFIGIVGDLEDAIKSKARTSGFNDKLTSFSITYEFNNSYSDLYFYMTLYNIDYKKTNFKFQLLKLDLVGKFCEVNMNKVQLARELIHEKENKLIKNMNDINKTIREVNEDIERVTKHRDKLDHRRELIPFFIWDLLFMGSHEVANRTLKSSYDYIAILNKNLKSIDEQIKQIRLEKFMLSELSLSHLFNSLDTYLKMSLQEEFYFH